MLRIAGAHCQKVERAVERPRDVEMSGEGVGGGAADTVRAGHGIAASDAEGDEGGLDKRRIDAGREAEGVAGLVGQAGSGEVDHDMPHVLG